MNTMHNQSVQDIIEKIRNAVGERNQDNAWNGSQDFDAGRSSLPDFFQTPYLDVGRQSFDVQELLRYQDRTFLTIAYQALLKRDPDPGGFETYLRLLRNNPGNKRRILANIRYCPEGEDCNVTVKGLTWEKIRLQLQKPLLLGKLMRLLFSLNTPIGAKKELARQQGRMEQLMEEIGQAMRVIAGQAQTAIDTKVDKEDLSKKLVKKADKEDLAKKADTHDLDRYLRSVGHVLDMIHEINHPLPEKKPDPCGVDAYSGSWLDELYLSFEDAFRGPGKSIQRKMEVYLPLLRDVTARVPVTDAPPPLPDGCAVLDLGCGRGEFLALLVKNNIRAMGIDSNRLMRGDGETAGGLHTRQEDMFGFLAKLPAECLTAVTAFHVVEHFPFEQQLLLIDQIRRVLLPGGMIILETPNPCNILVGAIDFYRDPTHLRPIHPDTLLFLARSRGFARAAIFFPKESEKNGLVLEDASKTAFTDLQDYVTVSRDYALIAYKC